MKRTLSNILVVTVGLFSFANSVFAIRQLYENPVPRHTSEMSPAPKSTTWNADGYFPLQVMNLAECQAYIQAYEGFSSRYCLIDYTGTGNDPRSLTDLKRRLKTKCSTDKCTKSRPTEFKNLAQVCQIHPQQVDMYLGTVSLSNDMECMKIDNEFCTAHMIQTERNFIAEYENKQNDQSAFSTSDSIVLKNGKSLCSSCSVQWSVKYTDKSDIFIDYFANNKYYQSLITELRMDYHRAEKFSETCPASMKTATTIIMGNSGAKMTFRIGYILIILTGILSL